MFTVLAAPAEPVLVVWQFHFVRPMNETSLARLLPPLARGLSCLNLMARR
jgi:hypothetical protein